MPIVSQTCNRISDTTDPFFYFVHLNDAHLPYSPVSPYHNQFSEKSPLRLFWSRVYTQRKLYGSNRDRNRKLSELEKEALYSLYLACVRQVDDYVQRIIDCLKKNGKFENTVIAIFGDHGEGFGEHGRYGHHLLETTVTHVPLVIYDPTNTLTRDEIDNPTQLLDLYPTLASIMGVDVPETRARNLISESRELAFAHDCSPSSEPHINRRAVYRSRNDYLIWNQETDEYMVRV